MFRVQDKGSRLVLEWKEEYTKKVIGYLQNKKILGDVRIKQEYIKKESERVGKEMGETPVEILTKML